MIDKSWKKLAGIAAAGVGSAVLAIAVLDGNGDLNEASLDDGAAQIDEDANPWGDQMIASECPELPGKDGANLLQGNWLARWDGVPRKDYFIGGQHFDSAHLTVERDEAANRFMIYGSTWFRDGAASIDEVPEKAGRVNPIELEPPRGGALQTSFQFYSAPFSTLSVDSASPDQLAGTWEMRHPTDKEEKIYGNVTWDRAAPGIHRVLVASEQTVDAAARADTAGNSEFCGAKVLRTSEPLVAIMMYSKDDWSDGFNKLRANRPTFTIDVYGDNLWGDHEVSIDLDNTGIEAEAPRSIRSSERSSETIGLRIDINIWYGVQPGWYTLYIDDVAIPFKLDIPNFYPEVTLEYVNYDPTNDTERVLEDIPINQVFWVRATVENPERFDDTQPLVLTWRGEEFSAPAMKTSTNRYRAGPYMVSENLLPSTVAPANDPCKDNKGDKQ